MIDDREIWTCANILIKRYGEDAPDQAKRRAADLLAEGDEVGHAVWRRIEGTVLELLRDAPSTSDHLH